MPFPIRAIHLPLLLVLTLALAACAGRGPRPDAPVPAPARDVALPQPPAPAAPTPPAETEPQDIDTTPPCLECEAVDPAQDRDRCFSLQPGKKVKNSKGQIVAGRCQPQCIPYARCRSGIMTCRLGDTGPVEWFECAQKSKATTNIPKAGSLMVLDVNKRHNMPTGHLGYVEEACPNADGTWSLRFSHTNYDRKCHLDLDAKVHFNPATMTVTFLSGPWKTWARNLKIRGFILR